MGQREENRRNRDEAEGHAAARRNGRGRYGRRSLQGYVVGGADPGHQVHHAVRIAGGRTGCGPGVQERHAHTHTGGGVLPDFVLLRLPLILWDEDYSRRATIVPFESEYSREKGEGFGPPPFLFSDGNYVFMTPRNWPGSLLKPGKTVFRLLPARCLVITSLRTLR